MFLYADKSNLGVIVSKLVCWLAGVCCVPTQCIATAYFICLQYSS